MAVDLALEGFTDAVEAGWGGFGVVYRAYQPSCARDVAIKVLNVRPEADLAQEFQRECAAIGSLSGHPNIVAVHSVGETPDGRRMAYAGDKTVMPGPDDTFAGIGRRVMVLNARRIDACGDRPGLILLAVEDATDRLRTAEGARRYKRRGATVEPAIGNLKKIITRFSGRGLQAATAEIDLAAAAFNLLKIHRAGPATA